MRAREPRLHHCRRRIGGWSLAGRLDDATSACCCWRPAAGTAIHVSTSR